MSVHALKHAAQMVIDRWEGGDLAEAVRALQGALDNTPSATQQQRDMAEEQYGTDDIEINDDALVSEGPDGTGYWVSAWVWVPTPEKEVDGQCARCGKELFGSPHGWDGADAPLCADCHMDDQEVQS